MGVATLFSRLSSGERIGSSGGNDSIEGMLMGMALADGKNRGLELIPVG